MVYKLTSSKEIIAKAYRDLNIRDANKWQDMIEWIGEALEAIGAFSQLSRKEKTLDIESYKACLPKDFYLLQQVSYNGKPLPIITGTLKNIISNSSTEENLSVDINTPNLLSTFTDQAFGYYIEGSYIKTNFESGEVKLAYLAFPLCDNGFPMVPDEYYYKEALLAYIVKKMKYPDYITGAIPRYIWGDIEMNWEYKCGQARANANMPDLPKMEAIKNMWVRLIPDINSSSTFFNDLGNANSPSML